MEKIKDYYLVHKKIILFVLSILLFSFLCFSIFSRMKGGYGSTNVEESISINNNENAEINDESIKETEVYYFVDIKGKVKNPGVYKMNKNDRVNDVIKKAGGLLSDANTLSINLSMKVKDEMVIFIHSQKEIDNYIDTLNQKKNLIDNCNSNIIINNDSCIDNREDIEKDDEIIKISINTASIEELMKLPSIGESKANSIIKYREENGPFKTIGDIKNVSGIGEALFEKIKDYITI